MSWTRNLHGVNKPSLEWRTDGAHWVEQDVATMKDWGCNCWRVTFTGEWWRDNVGTIDGMRYRDKLDQAIAWGEKYGLTTILACIWWLRKEKLTPLPSDISGWIEMWRDIAGKYNGRNVIFDLWGEPYSTNEEWISAAQRCVDAVRQICQNTIIIGATNWAHDAWFVEHLGGIQGDNIVYGLHLYPIEVRRKGLPLTVEGTKEYLRLHNWEYLFDNNIPVFVGEFGAYPDDAEAVEWIKAFGRIMNGLEGEKYRMGYTAWWFIPEHHALVEGDWVTPSLGGEALIEVMKGVPSLPPPETCLSCGVCGALVCAPESEFEEVMNLHMATHPAEARPCIIVSTLTPDNPLLPYLRKFRDQFICIELQNAYYFISRFLLQKIGKLKEEK